jgi:heme-degrading monooxygenase HmoA
MVTVLVRNTAVGLDEATYDQIAPALHPLVKAQPGFILHVAYPVPNGFIVSELWESKAQHETWFNEFVKPNLPDPEAMTTEYIDLHAMVQP